MTNKSLRVVEQEGGEGQMRSEQVATLRPGVAERVTVGLIAKVTEDLRCLVEDTGLSKTDVINRAISVYAYINKQLSNGQELVFRDPDTGKERIVEII